jgi:PLP dependent protein
MSISNNIAMVQQKIHAAAQRAGRQPDEIALMAVSKTHPPDVIREAYAAGIRIFGENRVQEFAGKKPFLSNVLGAEWHMIGHLQTNKATKAVELCTNIDSLDSVRLAEKLNSAAQNQNRKISVLIEINIGGEDAKSGISADSTELQDLLKAAAGFEALQFAGLMTVPPFTEDPEGARPYFRNMRELSDRITAQKLPSINMSVLSMGMSHDFEVAIQEGSNCVRVGTAIFGERKKF